MEKDELAQDVRRERVVREIERQESGGRRSQGEKRFGKGRWRTVPKKKWMRKTVPNWKLYVGFQTCWSLSTQWQLMGKGVSEVGWEVALKWGGGWVSEFRKVCQKSDHRDEEGRQLLAVELSNFWRRGTPDHIQILMGKALSRQGSV